MGKPITDSETIRGVPMTQSTNGKESESQINCVCGSPINADTVGFTKDFKGLQCCKCGRVVA